MKKIEKGDNSYRINLGRFDLYCDDLIIIIQIIKENFEIYKLILDDYEITNEDNIEEDLKQLKNKGISNIKSLELNAVISAKNAEFSIYPDLKLNISERDSNIYSNSADALIKGTMHEIETIINKRKNKLKTIVAHNYLKNFLFILSIVFFIFWISIFFNLDYNSQIIFDLIALIWFVLVLCSIFMTNNKIYLIQYNKKSSWFSKNINPTIRDIVVLVIGGVIVAVIVWALNL